LFFRRARRRDAFLFYFLRVGDNVCPGGFSRKGAGAAISSSVRSKFGDACTKKNVRMDLWTARAGCLESNSRCAFLCVEKERSPLGEIVLRLFGDGAKNAGVDLTIVKIPSTICCSLFKVDNKSDVISAET
jgi:hypothetical protein